MSIEGIPEGWELVEIGMPKTGDWMISAEGEPYQVICDHSTFWPIIRKIEKPKRHRPFANAAEFEPHRDKWIKRSCKSDGDRSLTPGCFRVSAYDDDSFWTVDGETTSYEGAFESGKKFEDGTPFGVEVTE